MTAGLWIALVGGVIIGYLGLGFTERARESGRRGKSKAKRAGKKIWNWGATAAIVAVAVLVMNERTGAVQ